MHVVVLSPHRDDAAFSSGLLLHQLLQASAAISIVNICTRSDYAPYFPSPADQPSPAALPSPARSYTEDVTAARAAEDVLFLRTLTSLTNAPAPRVAELDLAWSDAPLRRHLPTPEVLLPADLSPTEVSALCTDLCALPFLRPPDLVLAPLALGGHLDHRLAHAAALAAFPPDRLAFYEDLPYVARIEPHLREEARRQILPAFATQHLRTAPAAPGLKQQLALCYPSQIAADVAAEMESYAATLGHTEQIFGAPAALALLNSFITPAEVSA